MVSYFVKCAGWSQDFGDYEMADVEFCGAYGSFSGFGNRLDPTNPRINENDVNNTLQDVTNVV